jgi:hypothetical protein
VNPPLRRKTGARQVIAAGLALLAVICLFPGVARAQQKGSERAQLKGFQRGVSLGLFSEDPLWSYKGLLKEIAALGASHVELVVAYYQKDGASTEITRHPRFTAPDEAVVQAIRDARAAGLQVLLFPIVRLSDPRPGEWRGTLKPRDRAAWWRSYTALLVRVAGIAAREGVALLSVGSELSTLDTERGPWQALIGQVRRVYRGPLTYSGNWDHYQKVALYDLVDLAGVCGYFSLAGGKGATQEELVAAWQEHRKVLLQFAARVGRPLLFTEVGYLSQAGAAAWPWDEGAKKPVDLEEQRRCYDAFAAVWQDAPGLAGVYFWNWYGWGGKASGGYTPRGKPAAEVIRRYFTARP